GAGTGDNVGPTVAVQVPGGHVEAIEYALVVGVEAEQHRGVGAAEDGDVGSGARTGAADQVRVTVGVHVAGGDADAAGEIRVVGIEVEEHIVVVGVEDQHVRSAAGIGARHDNVRRVHVLYDRRCGAAEVVGVAAVGGADVVEARQQIRN